MFKIYFLLSLDSIFKVKKVNLKLQNSQVQYSQTSWGILGTEIHPLEGDDKVREDFFYSYSLCGVSSIISNKIHYHI